MSGAGAAMGAAWMGARKTARCTVQSGESRGAVPRGTLPIIGVEGEMHQDQDQRAADDTHLIDADSGIDAPKSGPQKAAPEYGPGSMIAPRVCLDRPLARGGMSTVWIARHLGLNVDVAVKLVTNVGGDAQTQIYERFRREAAISARIRSVHVVQVFDHGLTPEGWPYMVMELLHGQSLAERLSERGRLDFSDTVRIVTQIAKALHAAHIRGITHRDVKPGNVFLVDTDYDIFVKLLDFGIAKQQTKAGRKELTRTGIGMGSPGFISPEAGMNAKIVDHRADLWSLGAVAYAALTGFIAFGDSTPFGGATNRQNWLIRLFQGQFVPPSEIVSDLPPAVDDWFARALEPYREKRFQTAREMAESLVALARGARPSLAHGGSAMDEEGWTPGTVSFPASEGDEAAVSTKPRPYTAPTAAGSDFGTAPTEAAAAAPPDRDVQPADARARNTRAERRRVPVAAPPPEPPSAGRPSTLQPEVLPDLQPHRRTVRWIIVGLCLLGCVALAVLGWLQL